MTAHEALRRLGDIERLALKAREEGRDLSAWAVIQVCEGRVRLPQTVAPLTHDLPGSEPVTDG